MQRCARRALILVSRVGAVRCAGALMAVSSLLLPGSMMPAARAAVLAAPCDPPVTNPVACENTLPGTPSSQWDLAAPNSGDPSLQGFATDSSVNKGSTISFKINTP